MVAQSETLYAKCHPGLKRDLRLAAEAAGCSDAEFIRRAVSAAASHVFDVLDARPGDPPPDLDVTFAAAFPIT